MNFKLYFRASYVSVLTIVAFSTERYVAICYPLYLHTMSGLQRPIRIITCLWIIGLLSAIPFAVYTGIDYVHVDVHNVSEQIQVNSFDIRGKIKYEYFG